MHENCGDRSLLGTVLVSNDSIEGVDPARSGARLGDCLGSRQRLEGV